MSASIINQTRIALGIIIILGVLVASSIYKPNTLDAQTITLLQPLGGKTGGVDEVCTCSGGVLLKYTDLKNQTKYLVYQLGVSTIFENYNSFTQGYYTVLNYFPVGICLIYNGESCESSSNTPNGTLFYEGTGGLPASSF